MRSGEWLPTQWIARVAFGLGTEPEADTGRAKHCGHFDGLSVNAPVEERLAPCTGKGSWPESSSASTFPDASGAHVRPEYVRPPGSRRTRTQNRHVY
jgi:hypothetical protein